MRTLGAWLVLATMPLLVACGGSDSARRLA